MNKTKSGFTIVELLIVIVVIAILASISVVAYNGIQTRSKNTKTLSAASTWIKALKLYNAEKSDWPDDSCLGKTTTYVGNNNQCWNDAYWRVNATFLTQMQPYISDYPEPDTTNVASAALTPRRGLLYSRGGGTSPVIYIFLQNTSTCPNVGLTLQATTAEASGVQCLYNLT